MNALFLLGRVLFGGYFVYNGINHLFLNHDMLAGFAGSKGVPQPHAAVHGSGALLVAGGLSLMTGVQPKVGGAMILAFLFGVSPTIHDFWNEEGQQRMGDTVNFLKNMALVAATLEIMSRPEPWPLSLAGKDPAETGAARRAA